MRKKLQITSIVFGALIIIISIVLLSLQLTVDTVAGPIGKVGPPGKDEVGVPNKFER